MAGRFEGLSDEQWNMFADLISSKERKVGRKPSCGRAVLNTILYVLFTGCRWCDVPIKDGFAKRSTAHDRLATWSRNGVLEKIKRRFLELAQLNGSINWERSSVDGSFSPGEGWWRRRSSRLQRQGDNYSSVG